jgi:hypothetical protein
MTMAKMDKNEMVLIDSFPDCDVCGDVEEARYDSHTKMGAWGFLCEPCFKKHGTGLGLGHGQKLVLR